MMNKTIPSTKGSKSVSSLSSLLFLLFNSFRSKDMFVHFANKKALVKTKQFSQVFTIRIRTNPVKHSHSDTCLVLQVCFETNSANISITHFLLK